MLVTILRGIPGSGKSTYIQKTIQKLPEGASTVVCSADHFFMVNGEYLFNPKLLEKAHRQCFLQFLDCITLRINLDLLIVDNTNIHAWEIAPYWMLANSYGHEVVIQTVLCDPLVATARNQHGVSREKVFAMYQNLLAEKLPGHWKQEIIG